MPTITKKSPDEVRRLVSEVLADKRSQESTRDFVLERAAIDEKARTVPLSFASETPVERWFGSEILECTSDACDLKRLRNGGALLLDHNSRDQIGVIESCEVKGGKCRAIVRFSKSARAQEIFQDVIDGIRSLVSVGYRVKNMVLAESDTEAGDSYRVTEWEPYEISLVSIPADDSVGVGRSKETTATKSLPKMAETTTTTEEKPKVEAVQERKAPPADNSRITEIIALGRGFNVPQERINKALAESESAADFAQVCLREFAKAEPVATPPTIGMNRAERRRYSMTRAINRIANRQELDGLEREASDAAAKLYKREVPAAGFILPHDMSTYGDRELIAAMLRVSPSLAWTPYGKQLERGLLANNFTGAGALIAEDFLGGSFIELLRNRALLTSLGVGTLSGLTGNVAIPRQSAAATAYWLDEGAAVTASQQAFAQVLATPKRLAAQTAYNKQLLAQSTLDVEALVRDDHVRIIALAKDLAGIQGTGGSQPRGILNGPTTDSTGGGNNVTSLTWGTTATRTNQLAFMAAIQTANADLGTIQWLTNPTVRAKWQSIPQVSNYPVFLTNDEGLSIGYPTNITNQISTTGTYANRTILGAWGQAMFCDWAGYDIVVDPYTRAANNEIVVTVNLMTDFIVRHWPSFAISSDSGAQ
ncbi:MAG TPA: phage major capsid protein [Xanthobacteraceae bacterium]|jgi:HK97 family phage major capsid protein|nr:phage major capsid protein [Xanthobacteraceae bacterium]